MTWMFWLLPALGALAILYALRPASGLRADQIWALTAVMPLAAALAGAAQSQAEARAALRALPAAQASTFITVQNGLQVVGLELNPEQAACFERTRRTSHRAEWLTEEGGPVQLLPSTDIRGHLPPPELARALAITGQLDCHAWVHVLPDKAPEGAAQVGEVGD